MQLPQPGIDDQAKLQQLVSMLGGKKDKTRIAINDAGFLDIQITGIPYEIAIPSIINMLVDLMKAAADSPIIEKEENTDGSGNGSNSSIEIR